jgi:hypothetical protein
MSVDTWSGILSSGIISHVIFLYLNERDTKKSPLSLSDLHRLLEVVKRLLTDLDQAHPRV